jgi:hypothetical protein
MLPLEIGVQKSMGKLTVVIVVLNLVIIRCG